MANKDPSAAKVIERAIRKIGGRKRLETVRDMKIESQYATYSDTILFRHPDRVRRDSNFPWGQLQVGFDGERSWHTLESGRAVNDEHKQAPAVQWLFHFVDTLLLNRLLENEAELELAGARTVEVVEKGETVRYTADAVKVSYPDDWAFIIYFNRKNGLAIKLECVLGGAADRKLVRFFRRYGSHHRILLPERIIEFNPHNRERTKTTVRYSLNAGLRRHQFRIPRPVEVPGAAQTTPPARTESPAEG